MSVETKTGVEASDAAVLAAATKNRARIGTLLSLTLLGLLALMWVALAFSTTSFWSYNNITNLLRQGAMTAILSIGETFVIITAGIDLSVGAVVGFASVIIAWLLTHDFPVWASILITLAFGICIGTFHAFGVSRLGLPPFIMTLATLTALRGVGLLITNGRHHLHHQRCVHRLFSRRIYRRAESFLDGGRGRGSGLHILAPKPFRPLPLRYRL